MEVFYRAKSVRLKSCHDKYLTADEDEESVIQDRRGSAKAAKWTVEFVDNGAVVRLKSCYGKYLTASSQAFLLGMTGRKVVQSVPKELDGTVEWEAVKENGAVKLRSRKGKFLRANGGVRPWKNSVTHDGPHRTVTTEWCAWEVHVVEFLAAPMPERAPVVERLDSAASPRETRKSDSFARQELNDDIPTSWPKTNSGRLIYFHVADENGKFDDSFEELSIAFKGNKVDDLTRMLEDKLGFYGITVCGHNPLNQNLYPLRLQLPPNNTNMHVIVIPSTTLRDGIEGGIQSHKSLEENAKVMPMMMA